MAQEHRSYDYLFKVVLIGDSGVGKTSILKRYRTNEFSPDTKHTIGVEFATQELEIQGHVVKTQIWDTAGQERYRAITKAYYRGALGAILVYDISDHETFDNLKRWLNEIKQHAAPDIKVLLIGNKSDLEDSRAVQTEEGKTLAQQHGLAFLEASAKSGQVVKECFETVVRQIYDSARAKENESKMKKDNEADGRGGSANKVMKEGEISGKPIDLKSDAKAEKSSKACCG